MLTSHLFTSLLPFAFLAAGLAGALTLFVSIKRELYRQSHSYQVSIDQVLDRLKESERAAPAPAAPLPIVALRPGLNVHKRVQALRLLRRGEDISHIAAALGVPRREVELLIRVNELSVKRAAAGGP
jgi:DNA-binding transcriptional ArsR family regulator